MCQQDSKAVILHQQESIEIQSKQTVYQTVYKKTYVRLYSIPTVITKVQLINLMSKVPNRFSHHNTLRERIPHIDSEFVHNQFRHHVHHRHHCVVRLSIYAAVLRACC